ncbi:MAG: 30S ribosomal protein S12 methylthiotransferase RimO [Clostridiaceae bacterium]|nr:30S ribosomal protein S12 methylthiotransferase RimO [Clostridiaceae bacterium]
MITDLRVAIVTLGCAKNLVDSEAMVALLRAAGIDLVSEPEDAEVIIVNTCAFIEAAKREAIETILDMADFKADKCRFLVAAGCLSQRYAQEIAVELPEVDAIVGTGSYYQIVDILERLSAGEAAEKPLIVIGSRDNALRHLDLDIVRRPETPGYAYIKIAEGCSSACAYCAIPGIRGRLRSRPIETLVREAQRLIADGYGELILIAQETTDYGRDLYGKPRLPDLLRALAALPGAFALRLMYCYSDGLTDELLEVMATEAKILPYLDVPIQHASPRILKAMRRRDNPQRLREVLAKWRARIPNLTLRTTVMVGFPGETEADFAELMDFIAELRFDHLGTFTFCPEDGTPAATMPGQVDPEVAAERERRVIELQQRIVRSRWPEIIGSERRVLIEGIDEEGLFYLGHSEEQAPEVDPGVAVLYEQETEPGEQTTEPEIGKWYNVRIIAADFAEWTGVTIA